MIHYICKYTPIELFAGFGAECIPAGAFGERL